MSTPENRIPEKEDIQVPRDPRPENNAPSETIPPEGNLTKDEDYAQAQQGLPEDSPVGKALHHHPPTGVASSRRAREVTQPAPPRKEFSENRFRLAETFDVQVRSAARVALGARPAVAENVD